MKDKDIKVLLKKADELRSLFVLGQRVIPFLEEIFLFVSEIEPLLDEINVSIEENLKKMPNASEQLSKVTEATELATNEIMDIVDGVVYKSEIINSNIEKLTQIEEKKRTIPLKMLEVIYKAIKKDSDLKQILPQLTKTIKTMKNTTTEEQDKIISETNELLQSISMDSSSIMMSLQVQDITSQQIAAVNNLLEAIQTKLRAILKRFQTEDISELVNEQEDFDDRTNVSKLHRNIAFDPDAVGSYANKDTRQSEIDQMMNDHQNGKLEEDDEAATEDDDNSPTSQDDIDALFEQSANGDEETIDDSNKADDEQVEEEEKADKNQAEEKNAAEENQPQEAQDEEDESDGSTEFSQDDIDALFNNNN